MAHNIPSYLFHIPHMRDMLDAEQLEQKMQSRKPPEVVGVVDMISKKRLGNMHPNLALIKFR